MAHKEVLKTDNRGLSLVELIIAISIGVIVSGAIAALITFALRTYRNESVNTSMQYELQSNINMMMDEIMCSSSLVVSQNGGEITELGKAYTKYAMFGTPNTNITIGGATVKGFKGVIFVPSKVTDGKFKIYMKKVEAKLPDTARTLRTVKDLADYEYGTFGDLSGDFTKYLLGENATQFVIVPDPNNTSFDTSDPDASKHSYKNPIEVRVVLSFEDNGWGTKKYTKHVDETAYMRNKVDETVYTTVTPKVTDGNVYVNGKAYVPKKKDD
ncbi:MAG: prepilin-type N-terminal cleavage/methylation domain-containing protein [Lachnospiraceae bacterium]|nr:prepilin-type N-terminal cleavage/methylation domain-containing protein [Lachnospiraceae bacterium]